MVNSSNASGLRQLPPPSEGASAVHAVARVLGAGNPPDTEATAQVPPADATNHIGAVWQQAVLTASIDLPSTDTEAGSRFNGSRQPVECPGRSRWGKRPGAS